MVSAQMRLPEDSRASGCWDTTWAYNCWLRGSSGFWEGHPTHQESLKTHTQSDRAKSTYPKRAKLIFRQARVMSRCNKPTRGEGGGSQKLGGVLFSLSKTTQMQLHSWTPPFTHCTNLLSAALIHPILRSAGDHFVEST